MPHGKVSTPQAPNPFLHQDNPPPVITEQPSSGQLGQTVVTNTKCRCKASTVTALIGGCTSGVCAGAIGGGLFSAGIGTGAGTTFGILSIGVGITTGVSLCVAKCEKARERQQDYSFADPNPFIGT